MNKKHTVIMLLIPILLIQTYCIAQPYIPRYKSMTQEEIMYAPMIMRQRADNTAKYLDQILTYIIDLRKKTSDQILDNYLKSWYDYFSQFYTKDLANYTVINTIKTNYNKFSSDLLDYQKNASNNQQNLPKNHSTKKSNPFSSKANSNLNSKKSSSSYSNYNPNSDNAQTKPSNFIEQLDKGTIVLLKINTVLYDKPSVSGNGIFKLTDDTKVQIIDKTNNPFFFETKYGNEICFLHHSSIKSIVSNTNSTNQKYESFRMDFDRLCVFTAYSDDSKWINSNTTFVFNINKNGDIKIYKPDGSTEVLRTISDPVKGSENNIKYQKISVLDEKGQEGTLILDEQGTLNLCFHSGITLTWVNSSNNSQQENKVVPKQHSNKEESSQSDYKKTAYTQNEVTHTNINQLNRDEDGPTVLVKKNSILYDRPSTNGNIVVKLSMDENIDILSKTDNPEFLKIDYYNDICYLHISSIKQIACENDIDNSQNNGTKASNYENNSFTKINIQKVVERHNYWRKQVNTPPLKWDENLAKEAQQWANKLAREGNVLRHSLKKGMGENIWAGYGTGASEIEIIDAWADERHDYDWKRLSSSNFNKVGHYTQIIWKTTTKVGCAMAKGSSGIIFCVCNYSPAGNYMGQHPTK